MLGRWSVILMAVLFLHLPCFFPFIFFPLQGLSLYPLLFLLVSISINPPASASQGLGLQLRATVPNLYFLKIIYLCAGCVYKCVLTHTPQGTHEKARVAWRLCTLWGPKDGTKAVCLGFSKTMELVEILESLSCICL